MVNDVLTKVLELIENDISKYHKLIDNFKKDYDSFSIGIFSVFTNIKINSSILIETSQKIYNLICNSDFFKNIENKIINNHYFKDNKMIECKMCGKIKKIESSWVFYSGYFRSGKLFCNDKNHYHEFNKNVFNDKFEIFIFNFTKTLNYWLNEYRKILDLINKNLHFKYGESKWFDIFTEINHKTIFLFEDVYTYSESIKYNIFYFLDDFLIGDHHLTYEYLVEERGNEIRNIQNDKNKFLKNIKSLLDKLKISKDPCIFILKYNPLFYVDKRDKEWVQFTRNNLIHNLSNFTTFGMNDLSNVKSFNKVLSFIPVIIFDNIIFVSWLIDLFYY